MGWPRGKPALAAFVLLHGVIVAALVVSIDNAALTAHGVGVAGIAVSLSSGNGSAGQAAAPPIETVDAADGTATSLPTEDTREETPPVDPELVETPADVEPPADKPVEVVDTASETAAAAPEPVAALEPELTHRCRAETASRGL